MEEYLKISDLIITIYIFLDSAKPRFKDRTLNLVRNLQIQQRLRTYTTDLNCVLSIRVSYIQYQLISDIQRNPSKIFSSLRSTKWCKKRTAKVSRVNRGQSKSIRDRNLVRKFRHRHPMLNSLGSLNQKKLACHFVSCNG